MPNEPILHIMPKKEDNPLIQQWDMEQSLHPNRVYFNKPQLLTQYIAAKTTVIVAGRRTGKTDSIASPFVLRNMQRMPGSTGSIVVPTFKHGLTNTLPGLLAAPMRTSTLCNRSLSAWTTTPTSTGLCAVSLAATA